MQLLPQSPAILPYKRLPKQSPTTNKSGNRPVLLIDRLHGSCGPRVSYTSLRVLGSRLSPGFWLLMLLAAYGAMAVYVFFLCTQLPD